MWPASIRARDSAARALPRLVLLRSRSGRSCSDLASVRGSSQPSSPCSAARACALRCASVLQLGGERRDPGVGGQGLALDRDAADLAPAKALDSLIGDVQLVEVLPPTLDLDRGARAWRRGPAGRRRDARRGSARAARTRACAASTSTETRRSPPSARRPAAARSNVSSGILTRLRLPGLGGTGGIGHRLRSQIADLTEGRWRSS